LEYELSSHAVQRMQDRRIHQTWLDAALSEPDQLEQDQVDPTVTHAFKRIPEMDNRVLRVVYNAVRQPIRVISLYFDRGMKGKL
jgi:hypothetical protein